MTRENALVLGEEYGYRENECRALDAIYAEIVVDVENDLISDLWKNGNHSWIVKNSFNKKLTDIAKAIDLDKKRRSTLAAERDYYNAINHNIAYENTVKKIKKDSNSSEQDVNNSITLFKEKKKNPKTQRDHYFKTNNFLIELKEKVRVGQISNIIDLNIFLKSRNVIIEVSVDENQDIGGKKVDIQPDRYEGNYTTEILTWEPRARRKNLALAANTFEDYIEECKIKGYTTSETIRVFHKNLISRINAFLESKNKEEYKMMGA